VILTVKLSGCKTPFAVAFTSIIWLPAGGRFDELPALVQPVILPPTHTKSSTIPAYSTHRLRFLKRSEKTPGPRAC